MAGLGFGWVTMQSKAKQAQAAQSKAAALAPSPYAAIASGKADVEGGIIQVAARTAGIVQEVYVQEGQDVRKGQALAKLQDDQPRLNVASASAAEQQAAAQIALYEVQKRTAEREYARLQPLIAKDFVTRQSVDQAQDAIRQAEAQIAAQRAAVATARAQRNAAQYQLELATVRAPVDGKIVRRYANPGAGTSTLNVSNLFDLMPSTGRIVRAEITESDIPNVSVGQEVEIVPEADPTKLYPGRVLRRAQQFGARRLLSDDPSEKTDERVVEVVVAAEGAPLLIGQRVMVKFLKPGQRAGAAQATPAAGARAASTAKPA